MPSSCQIIIQACEGKLWITQGIKRSSNHKDKLHKRW